MFADFRLSAPSLFTLNCPTTWRRALTPCVCRRFDVRLFGGLMSDVRRRYSNYKSDIMDGLNLQCLATIVFLYFACITPIVTFGGMLGQTTDGYMVSTYRHRFAH